MTTNLQKRQQKQNARAKAALHYATDLLWHVLPLDTEGEPLADEATRDLALVDEYWRCWPDANVGVVTGAVSNLIALCIDGKRDGFASLARLQAEIGRPRSTLIAESDDGREVWLFAWNEELEKLDAVQLGPGLTLCGNGSYVAVPPSSVGGTTWRWTR